MLLVLLTYIVASISWGAILCQLTKVIVTTAKAKAVRPPLLIPLAIASLALFLESVYFGFSSWFVVIGADELFLASIQAENWFIIKLLIAVSGVLLLFNLKIDK